MLSITNLKYFMRAFYDVDTRFRIKVKLGLTNSIPDDEYLKRMYRYYFKRDLDLMNPVTFNEKLQWLKINNRNPEYTIMVDKFQVKDFVSRKIGEQYVIPTYGVWDRFQDINFDDLPNKFVLKCTHDSGGLVICKDKSKLDYHASRKKLESSLKRNFYWEGREWPYKNVKPRILAEKYMEDRPGSHSLTDFKFFCFDGVVKMMFVASDRLNETEETKFDFYDENFVHLPFIQGHPNSSNQISKPISFEKMKLLASKLSAGIPHVRVDFYQVENKIYFGEMTFFHFSGFQPIIPNEWDFKIGSWLKLPNKELLNYHK